MTTPTLCDNSNTTPKVDRTKERYSSYDLNDKLNKTHPNLMELTIELTAQCCICRDSLVQPNRNTHTSPEKWKGLDAPGMEDSRAVREIRLSIDGKNFPELKKLVILGYWSDIWDFGPIDLLIHLVGFKKLGRVEISEGLTVVAFVTKEVPCLRFVWMDVSENHWTHALMPNLRYIGFKEVKILPSLGQYKKLNTIYCKSFPEKKMTELYPGFVRVEGKFQYRLPMPENRTKTPRTKAQFLEPQGSEPRTVESSGISVVSNNMFMLLACEGHDGPVMETTVPEKTTETTVPEMPTVPETSAMPVTPTVPETTFKPLTMEPPIESWPSLGNPTSRPAMWPKLERVLATPEPEQPKPSDKRNGGVGETNDDAPSVKTKKPRQRSRTSQVLFSNVGQRR